MINFRRLPFQKNPEEGSLYFDDVTNTLYIACDNKWQEIKTERMFIDGLYLEPVDTKETPYEAIKSIVEGR